MSVELPPVRTPSDAIGALSGLAAAVVEGSISPAEGGEIAKILDSLVKAIEVYDLAERVSVLERGRPS